MIPEMMRAHNLPRVMSRFFTPILIVAATLLSGCSLFEKELVVQVDGYALPTTIRPGEYRLKPISPKTAENDLTYLAYAADLERTLARLGWHLAQDPESARTIIKFHTEVTGPMYSINEYQTPEYGMTGYNMNPVVYPVEVNGVVYMQSSSMMTPTYGFVGNNNRIVTSIRYTHTVVVEAYALPPAGETGPEVQIWKTIVTATDSRKDLRTLLPAMLDTAASDFGKNTGRVIDYTIPAPTPNR